MGEEPLDLDKHRGMAAQRATDLRRSLVEVENHAKELRDRQTALENQLLSLRAETWQEAAAKARYVLNLYVASLPAEDTRHRNLVAAILDDFSRLTRNA
jgi:predicted  nucleic acid-binding Zn-ribbon protein